MKARTRPHDDSAATRTDEIETRMSYFIPAAELKGSRARKVQKLDTLIAHLERLRRSLVENFFAERTAYEGPSKYIDAPVWPWLATGIVLGALFVLLLIAARYDFLMKS